MMRTAVSAVFPPRTLAQGAFTPELEVLRRQDPLAPAARRATKQSSSEHPIAEDGRRLPHPGLDAGVAHGILGAEPGLSAAERRFAAGRA
jgi:hypothetical protein